MIDPESLADLSLAEKRILLARLLQEKAQARSLFPLAHNQRGLWFLYQMDPTSSAYNIWYPSRIRSPIDVGAFHRALQTMIDRHASMRTTFEERDGQLLQRVHDRVPVHFEVVDASSWSEAEVRQRVDEEVHRPFDLEYGPLLRLHLFSRSAEDHVFLLTAHHIIGDFWSLVVVVDELRALYPAECQGKPLTLPPQATSYRDFVRWQADMLAGPDGERLWSYWDQQLADVPDVLELPTDRPRPPQLATRGATSPCRLGRDLVRRLKAVAEREQVTLNTVLLSAFAVLLGRYSEQNDFLIGCPFGGRTRPGFERVVGYFINMLPLRVRLREEMTFRDLLHQVGSTVLDAMQHQDYPFPLLVERLKVKRDPSRTPLVQVTFALEKAHRPGDAVSRRFAIQAGASINVGGLQSETYSVEHRSCPTDLEVVLEEEAGTVEGVARYNTDLFDAGTIARLVGHYLTLLEGIAESSGLSGSSRRVSQLPWLTEAERRQVLYDWNDTRFDYPQDLCLHQLFEQQAAKSPEAIAVRSDRVLLTYGELDARANRVAQRLRQLGVGPGALVVLCLERSPEMVAAILGTLKAGGAYVPLELASPAQRLLGIIDQVRPAVLLTQPGKAVAGWPAKDQAADVEGLAFLTSEHAGISPPALGQWPWQPPTPGDLAYVIFTSGSTGRPKGVMVEHAAICNTMRGHLNVLKVAAGDRMLLDLPYVFDASVCILFSALWGGAELVLPEPGEERDPHQLLERVSRDRVTVLPSVPGILRLLLTGPMRQSCQSLRLVCCGGEMLPADLLARLFEQVDVPLCNLYGPTEVAIDATWWVARPGDPLPNLLPIGRPIHNVVVYVLDRDRQPVPVGIPGELYVGGAGLARGYLNDPQLTAERFVKEPFSGQPDARMYRTGDRCRWLPDGNLVFLGRLDQQVKVRGYRVEVGEIEAVLEAAPGVKEAVVLADSDRLLAFVTPQPGEEPDPAGLRRHLKDRLPDYMLPAGFLVVPELPRTSTGKVDRKALPTNLAQALRPGQTSTPPATPLERFLAELWRDLLQLENGEQVSTRDNFFELGGNSIQAAQLITRLQVKLGEHVSTVAIFESPTIEGLVRYLAETCPQAIVRTLGPESLGRGTDAKSAPHSAFQEHPLVVPLHPDGTFPGDSEGDGTQPAPFFMVHPPGGIVVCYRPLALHLGSDRPCYGIRSRGLHEGEALPTRLEDMAAEYVSAIQTIQPQGPYHLGGWSMGGVVALEMAQQFLAQGQEVRLLALLDTTIPVNEANRAYVALEEDTGREYGLEITLEELEQMGPEQQLPYLWHHVQKLGLLEIDTPLEVVQQILEDLKRLFHAHIALGSEYAVRPYPGKITLFRPSEVPVPVQTAEDRGWGKLVREVEVHYVPGHHHSMVKEPQVQMLAEKLRECWRSAAKMERSPGDAGGSVPC